MRTVFLVATLPLVLACSASSGGGGGAGTAGGGASAGAAGAASGGGGGSGATGGGSTTGGEIGDACSTNADCAKVAGAECWTTIGGGPVPEITFPGGFCSKGCDPNGEQNECGDIAGCVSTGVSGGQATVTLSMCTPPCKANEECRVAEGYHCQIVIPGFGYCSL